ncbi:hypothetical protein U9M48_037321 [Paspalum notatum var. saurae]|uniref:AAA+ ATPase domain-containing protein n=1 Tax=Paspalum notatum var. saurae TaxID=547442 RepID=A0AAQ3XCA7_PASNO
MELALGAMARLAPKLGKLLKQEYVLQKGLKPDIESLSRELVMMNKSLADASKVLPDQLSDVDKHWIGQIRELSYDMEDAIDDFTVRVAGGCDDPAAATDAAKGIKKIAGKVTAAMEKFNLIKKIKDRHQLANKVKEIKELSKELADLHSKYTINGPGANLAATTGIDPRVPRAYKKELDLVGIEEARHQVINMLTTDQAGTHAHVSGQDLKIVSIVGVEGLGKTTLAKAVYDRLKEKFDCSVFFSVGRTPNMTRVFEKLLVGLDEKYEQIDMARWDLQQFCDKLHKFLRNKRYFIVVDDIWDIASWEIIKDFLENNNQGRSRIIMTTRNFKVINEAKEEVYRLKPLSNDNSKKLFDKSVHGHEGKCLDKIYVEVSSEIIDKCHGIPLAITAVASLLADKPCQDWAKVYDSIGFGKKEDNTMRILSYSYYDLPCYLKPCLLYLSMFPEDVHIQIHELIWLWIAEGFVQVQEEGHNRLFEIGERYFDELVNRSMIQVVEKGYSMLIFQDCHIHDIVLDLIRKLSREENFVTILSKEHCTSSDSSRGDMEVDIPYSGSKARRLTVQNRSVEHIPQDIMDRPEMLRSVCIQFSVIENMAPLCSFRACRVLYISYGRVPFDLKHLGKLRHLKCLVIRGTLVGELPKEIGQLKSLQALVLAYANEHHPVVEKLLPAICSLTQLSCLILNGHLKSLPSDSIGNLVSLEHLQLVIDRSVAEAFVVELGKLTRLKMLLVAFISEVEPEESLQKALVHSLCSLERLQEVTLAFVFPRPGDDRTLSPGTPASIWELWEPPKQLRRLYIGGMIFSRCPAWMNASCLPCLRYLRLELFVVEVRDLDNLARFPELRYLSIHGSTWPLMYTVGAEGFKNLRTFIVQTLLKFDMGAMPRLKELDFLVSTNSHVYVISSGSLVDLDFGVDKLLSLEHVTVTVYCPGATLAQVEETEAAVRRAVERHPNRLSLNMERLDECDILSDEKYRIQSLVHAAEYLVSVRKIKDAEADVGFICVLRGSGFLYLRTVVFSLDCAGASMWQVERVEVAIRHAVDILHNNPTLQLIRINIEEMASSSDHPNTEV